MTNMENYEHQENETDIARIGMAQRNGLAWLLLGELEWSCNFCEKCKYWFVIIIKESVVIVNLFFGIVLNVLIKT